MNTITRAVATQTIRTRTKETFRITAQGVSIVVLVVAILLSAFGVVYMKDLNRRLFIQYQALQKEKTQTLVEWGKLLLEQSTWSAQTRVQHIAERQLDMHVPAAKDIAMVKGDNADDTVR